MFSRTLFTALVALVSVATVPASDLTTRIRQEAQRGADALLNGDYATLIAITHPRIVEEMGGAEAAAAAVAESMTALKAEGVVMESVTIDPPSEPVAKGAVVAALLKQVTTIKHGNDRFRQVGHLLAVSEDGGTNWRFVDTSTLTPRSLVFYFPALEGLITLPEKQEAEQVSG